jgi:DNA-directed RNA polymerase subunit RPC12/RpoP
MSTFVLAVGVVCGGVGAYVAAMAAILRSKTRCPACKTQTLAIKSLTRGHVWPPPDGKPIDETLYACRTCGAEFGREGNGPLIPRHAWDAGAREAFPAAKALPKGRS